ncbi:MAG: bifunctional 2-C-methyl-D-erythritol 4-phosphate cytidylyltransferase/2-C-methyl-D-erythritol 2,4-cyclodiphosphate synthase [Pseudomonadota bacterium]
METAVVIVAAGRGTRAGTSDVPKQYRPVCGTPVLTRTLETFVAHPQVGQILTVIHEDDRDRFDAAASGLGDKLADPVIGGATRQASVRAGLEGLADQQPSNVLIHDAARPFADTALIDRVIMALDTSDGAVPALPVTDTLKKAEDGHVAATVERAGLWRAQTPQGFQFEKLLVAHEAAFRADKCDFTDDSSIAEWHGLDVVLVEGSEANVKLTTREDFATAEQRLQAGSPSPGEVRFGQGFDVHAFCDGDHVVLCGVPIAHDKGLAGHSDADVGLHALTDALLGAISAGDIGTHFPPSDPKWKGAASDQFLHDAASRVAASGGRIVNVDVTLICEAPKIGPHRDVMCKRIAEILEIDADRVSVKATTTERLGFTGRGEGIAAQAAATVRIG